jgi:transporter family-2 protein
MVSFYLAMVLLGGMLVPLQAGINMNLSALAGSSAWAAMVSFAVGTAVLFTYVLASRLPWPSLQTASGFPVWIWAGGVCGAYLVWMSVFLAPKVGAAVLIAFLVAGQLLGSLLFDHFGWLGFTVREISFGRVAGAVMIVAGAVLIRRF